MEAEQVSEEVRLHVESIGGLDETEVRLAPGITVLSGWNATNHTSLFWALMTVLGSERYPLKGEFDRDSISLEIDGTVYTRTLKRQDGETVTDGDPYLDDAELADLFAFLLEANEARRAVEDGRDLHDVIMRPVDTDSIDEETQALLRRRDRLDEEIEEIDSRKRALPDLEAERERLRAAIEETRAGLAAKEDELSSADASIHEPGADREQLEAKLEALGETRRRLEWIRFDIETEQESIASLRDERAEIDTALDELPAPEIEEINDIDPEIDRHRNEQQRLNAEVGDLQSTIEFNEQQLEEGRLWAEDAKPSDTTVTDQLLTDGTSVRCWTCGSTVREEQIQSTIDRLREVLQEKVSKVKAVRDRIDELAAERKQLEATRERRDELERRRSALGDELEERNERQAELRARRSEAAETVGDLEAEIETLDTEEYQAVLSLHRQANELEFELEGLETELEETSAEIAEIEDQLDDRERLRADRDAIQTELKELRTRIDRLETTAVERFNENMVQVLDLLEYDNLDRIWIERTEQAVREGRQTVERSSFDLHVVRTTESGATYEDTVDHLSESEREVTGLVFALAGYLVHEVHETLPFMLLDSLEAIDADRIAMLLQFLGDQADYLVVALLEEHAAALNESYAHITAIS